MIQHRLCFHPDDPQMPDHDVMLAQKLWLEHDEDFILKKANKHATLSGSERVLASLQLH